MMRLPANSLTNFSSASIISIGIFPPEKTLYLGEEPFSKGFPQKRFFSPSSGQRVGGQLVDGLDIERPAIRHAGGVAGRLDRLEAYRVRYLAWAGCTRACLLGH